MSGILCYHGYKPAGAQQAPPLWEGLRRQRAEEGLTWELYHSNVLAKFTLSSKLQTAALINDQTNNFSSLTLRFQGMKTSCCMINS